MKFCAYELEIFDELLHGQLAPKNIRKERIDSLTDYLNTAYDQAFQLTIVDYTKAEEQIEISQVRHLSNAHPLADQYFTFERIFDSASSCSTDIPEVLRKLNMPEDLSQIVVNDCNHISITQMIEWSSLNENRIQYYYYSTLLKTELRELHKKIRTSVFLCSDPYQAEFYIRKLQSEINNLSNSIATQHNLRAEHLQYAIKESYSDQDIYALIFLQLGTVQTFIETNYLPYLDKTADIPYQSKLVDACELSFKVEDIAQSLANADLPNELSMVLIEPLRKATGINLYNRISYNELAYLHSLISILHNYCPNNTLTETKLLKILLELNFNHPDFFKYLCGKIKQKVKECESYEQKRIVLHKYLKSVQQSQIRIKLAFTDKCETLKYDLIHWITEEIQYQEKKYNQASVPSIPKTTREEMKKISSDLSVGQLALLFKLLCESGCISHQNQQDILKMITHNFKTSSTDDISLNSLQNKFYQHDPRSVQEVRYKLIEMLNLIKEK